MESKEYMNATETAAMLGVSKSLLYKILKQPDFPACRLGGKWIISREGVEEWLKERMSMKA